MKINNSAVDADIYENTITNFIIQLAKKHKLAVTKHSTWLISTSYLYLWTPLICFSKWSIISRSYDYIGVYDRKHKEYALELAQELEKITGKECVVDNKIGDRNPL